MGAIDGLGKTSEHTRTFTYRKPYTFTDAQSDKMCKKYDAEVWTAEEGESLTVIARKRLGVTRTEYLKNPEIVDGYVKEIEKLNPQMKGRRIYGEKKALWNYNCVLPGEQLIVPKVGKSGGKSSSPKAVPPTHVGGGGAVKVPGAGETQRVVKLAGDGSSGTGTKINPVVKPPEAIKPEPVNVSAYAVAVFVLFFNELKDVPTETPAPPAAGVILFQ